MKSELEDARKLAHGIYDDVIVAEHRGASSPAAAAAGDSTALHIVLEMPEGSRAIDWAETYEIDGVASRTPPKLGASYRVIVGPPDDQAEPGATPLSGSLQYHTDQPRA